MKQIMKKLAALCAAAMVLSSCAGGAGKEASSTASEQAKGRYVEEEFAFPSDVQHIYDIWQDAEGALEIFAYLDGYTSGFYCSTDGGATWTKETPLWFESFRETVGSIDKAYYTQDGGLFVLPYREERQAEGYRVSKEGEIVSIDHLPASDGPSVNGLLETESGDLVFSNYFSLTQSDSAYNTKYEYEIDGVVMEGSYAASGDTLVVCEKSVIRLYDLNDGSLKTELLQDELGNDNARIHTSDELNTPARILSFDGTGESFYYCDSTGIYRRLLEGSVSERLVTGELSSLSMPSVTPYKLLLNKDGTIYVCAYVDERYVLLRYRYDAEAPTEPSTELKLYTLRDNKTIRQAIGMFQRQNPDVKVTCEVGADSDAAVSDALRAFNTQLLAGAGPDILVLDGLPLNNYIEKGVLADLSETLSEAVEALLPNIVEVFRSDGALYALPARFSVPMMGLPDGAESVDDVESLAAWLESQPNARLECTVPDALIRQFYPVMAPGWFGEDGALDQEAFSRSLSLLKRLAQIPGWSNRDYLEDMAQGEAKSGYLEYASVALSGKGISASLGPLCKFREAAAVDAAIQKLGGGALKPVSGERDAVFMPSAILGMNAAGKQQELAQRFIAFALSADVLQYELEDGLPVNRQALSKNAENPYTDEEMETGMGIYYSSSQEMEDGTWEVFEMNALWPSEAFMKDLIGALGTIKTVSFDEPVMLKMVLDETAGFFDGSKTLEETTESFAKKIRIYHAEQ